MTRLSRTSRYVLATTSALAAGAVAFFLPAPGGNLPVGAWLAAGSAIILVVAFTAVALKTTPPLKPLAATLFQAALTLSPVAWAVGLAAASGPGWAGVVGGAWLLFLLVLVEFRLGLFGALVRESLGGSSLQRAEVAVQAPVEPVSESSGARAASTDLSTEPVSAAASEAGSTCRLVNPDAAPTSWSRRWTSAVEDVLEGELTVEFAAGQREQVIHIPFVPKYLQPPRVDLEACDEQPLELRVTSVLSYGTRIVVRRPRFDEAAAVRIAFHVATGVGSETLKRSA